MLHTRFALAAALVVAFATSGFAQEKGRKVAFLVGVGKYYFKFTDLGKAPENDVTELAKVLKAGGFEVTILTSSGTGKDRATKANIDARFKAVLTGADGKPAIKKSDTLLVHLCGHGIQADALDPTTQRKEEQPFFCPADAKPDDTNTMVPLNGLIRAVEPHGATALFLVDACREAPPDANRSRTGIQGKQANLPAKTAVLFACGQGQLSHQSDKLGHGLFTLAVLRTLQSGTGLKDDVSWSQLVAGVETTFRTTEFKAMLPNGKTQATVLATGELEYTEIIQKDEFAAELNEWEIIRLNNEIIRPHAWLLDNALSEKARSRMATWKRHAEAGSPSAQVLYADCLSDGIGGQRNEKDADMWLRKAADAGNLSASFRMTIRNTLINTDVPVKNQARRLAEAGRTLLHIAQAGHMRAMWAVAKLYEGKYCLFFGDAEVLPVDLNKAREWYQKASDAGSKEAIVALQRLSKK